MARMWASLGGLCSVMTSCRTLAGWTAWGRHAAVVVADALAAKVHDPLSCPREQCGTSLPRPPPTHPSAGTALSRRPRIACGAHEGTTLNRRCVVTKTWPAIIQGPRPDWCGGGGDLHVMPLARVRPHLEV